MFSQSNKPTPNALIATVQKSGTWNSIIFLWLMKQLTLEAKTDEQIQSDLELFLRNRDIQIDAPHTNVCGIERLWICHSICPGFEEENSPHQEDWQKMNFHLWGYNWGEEALRNNGDWEKLSPQKNPAARLIYLSRNPLDQLDSFFTHARVHVDEGHRTRLDSDGNKVVLQNLSDFVFNAGALASYAKHYYTYKHMQSKYPKNVLLVSYEDLVTKPEETFRNMLTFMGVSLDSPKMKAVFARALALSSKENVMLIEQKIGRSFVKDRIDESRHVSNSAIGKWQGKYTQEELEKIEAVFQYFNMSLNDFNVYGDMANRSAPLPNIKEIDPKNVQQYQKEFFDHQNELRELQRKFPSDASIKMLDDKKAISLAK